MPSIISHSIVGLAAGKMQTIKNLPKRFWFFSILCPCLPDADVIGFAFGIHYGDFIGHRGFFHSIFFALLLSFLVVILFFRNKELFSKTWFLLISYFFIITASHGILDAFTSGGLGVALLSPFDNSRYFFPFTPIQVSPIEIQAFFSEWGVRVILSEFLWIWLPILFVLSFKYLKLKN